MPQQRALPTLVVQPLHAGSYSREAAQEQNTILRERLETARRNLDTIRTQYKTAAELGTRLSAWLREFGHGQLSTLREKRNGLQQSVGTLRDRERSIKEQVDAKRELLKELDSQEKEHQQHQRDADIAATNIEAFIRLYDAHFEIKRREQEDHRQAYQAAEKGLGAVAEADRQFNQLGPELERAENEARDSVRDLEKERSAIGYAAEFDSRSDEPLANLRQRYRGEVLRFEGRFKNTAAQGQLMEKQNQIQRLGQRTSADEFRDVKIPLAEALIADGKPQIVRTKAKIKCVMSALFSHAVRWEFCSHNPISSGIPVGSGGKRGPSVGVRVSAKRRRAPLVLSPEQVKSGLRQLEFRDQLLVFLDGALGVRRGELGALRWMDCDFENLVFNVQHSYYWRRGGHLKATKTEASAKLLPMHAALKEALLEWRAQSRRKQPEDFVFPSRLFQGRRPIDLAAVLKKKIKPAFQKVGIIGVVWHTFRHTVGTMLAEMGEHQLTIRDYLRHGNLHVTNKYLQATAATKRVAQDKLVDAILPEGFLSGSKTNSVQ